MPKLDPGRVDRTAARGAGSREGSREGADGGGAVVDAAEPGDRTATFGSVPALAVAVGAVLGVGGRTVAVGVAAAAAALDTATLRALGLLDGVEPLVAAGDTAALVGAVSVCGGLLYGLLRGATVLYRRGA